MSFIGVVLLFSGWTIVIAALVLLGGLGQRFGFVGAGLLVQLLGLGLMARSYSAQQRTSSGEPR